MEPALDRILLELKQQYNEIKNSNKSKEDLAWDNYVWVNNITRDINKYYKNTLIKKFGFNKNKKGEEFYIGDLVTMEWKGQKLIGEIHSCYFSNEMFAIFFYDNYVNEYLLDEYLEEMDGTLLIKDLNILSHITKEEILASIKDNNGKPYSIGDIVSSCNNYDPTSEDARFDIGNLIDFNEGDCTAILKNRFNNDYIYLDKSQLEKATIIGHKNKVTNNLCKNSD